MQFLDAVAGLPEQLAHAHEVAGSVHADAFPRGDLIRNIVVLGMGGSGISGDVVAAAFNDEVPVPIHVLKQIRTPAFVGPNTLAFAVSYSQLFSLVTWTSVGLMGAAAAVAGQNLGAGNPDRDPGPSLPKSPHLEFSPHKGRTLAHAQDPHRRDVRDFFLGDPPAVVVHLGRPVGVRQQLLPL